MYFGIGGSTYLSSIQFMDPIGELKRLLLLLLLLLLLQDMKQYSSSQFARMLKIAVWCLTSPEKHFAEVIRYSILGLGTDEDALTRAIVSRADIDMKMIKQEYRVRFKTTVTDDVVGDTSGYYMEILLALVGKE